MADAARLGKPLGFALVITGGIKNHGRRGQGRVSAQLLDELETVHGRNQNVSDDQFGALRPHQRQGLSAVRSLQQSMALGP